jgi:hypothetical protein
VPTEDASGALNRTTGVEADDPDPPTVENSIRAGCFERLEDTRILLRDFAGREGQPTAVCLDSRTLQSPPSRALAPATMAPSGGRDRRSTLPSTRWATCSRSRSPGADQGDRDQLEALSADIEQVTGGSVEMAYVDLRSATFDHPAGFDCSSQIAVFSGTSAAAPSMAGIAAQLNQRLGAAQGNLSPLLYQLAASALRQNSATNAFHDVTPQTSGVALCDIGTPSMCNNSTPAPGGLSGGLAGYPLTTGYDLATGLVLST